MKTWLLVDVSGLLYRAHFSLGQLRSPTGEPTGALYGFIRSFLKVEKELKPDMIVAIFDGPHNKQSRLELYADYKAHRKPTPPELIQQIQEAQHFCQMWGIPMLAIPHVEADDVLGSVTKLALQEKETQVVLCSHDKDLYQLLKPNVTLYNPSKDTFINQEAFEQEWGIKPLQFIDYLAILGDSSDNIPGIDGVGEKTAKELLQKYTSVENLYEHLDDFTGKKREKLEKSKEAAFISKKLATIDENVELPHLSSWKKEEVCPEKMEAFCTQKGFRSLLALIPEKPHSGPKTTFMPTILQTKEEVVHFLEKIPHQAKVALDIETTSLDFQKASIVGIGLAIGEEEKETYYIPCSHEFIKELLPLLNEAISHKKLLIIGHNLKFDLLVLKQFGFKIPDTIYDTLLASWLLRAHERTHGLDVLVQRYFHEEMIPIESLIGKGKNQRTMDQVPLEQIASYCGLDVHYTFRLYRHFENELNGTKLDSVLKKIELPLLPILLEMEEKGVFVSKEHLEKTGTYLKSKISELEKEIFSYVQEPFNLNSPKQLGEILYDQLHLPYKKKRGSDHRSTDAETLEKFFGVHPIIEKLLEYRQLEKLRSTYIDALVEHISTKTGRVHCKFMQAGTATGRLACQEPNLQNIPIKTEMGKRIREAFCAQHPHWKMISADYSQIELRILAHISQDSFLIDAFFNKKDIHAQTASQVFHVPLEEVTEEMRRKAKAVNFGVMYGQQAYGLSSELHIPVQEAQAFIDQYFNTYPLVRTAVNKLKEAAKEQGFAETLLGRKRALPDILNSQFNIRSGQERLAINTPFQGLAADIIKLAMLRVDHALKEKKLKTSMVLQIHDELLFESPQEEIEEASLLIKEAMEHVLDLSVPLTVEIGVGKNWREC